MTTNEVIKNADLYTMEDWHRDGYLKVKEGQVITPEVFWQLFECLPPHRWSLGIFQPGEPANHVPCPDKPGYVMAVYDTFERVSDDDHYRYIGRRP